MNIFLTNIKNRQCSALTLDKHQCNRHIMTFSKGIYFCHQHGNTILSPYHNYLYGYINEHSLYKLISNRYFSSKTYRRNLIRKRYVKCMSRIIQENFFELNPDVLREICKYI